MSGNHRIVQRTRSHSSADAPGEPEWRLDPSSPQPDIPVEQLFREMAENDDEFEAWRSAERRGELWR